MKATGAPPINRILRWHTSNIDTLGAMDVLLLLFCEGALLRGTSEKEPVDDEDDDDVCTELISDRKTLLDSISTLIIRS